MTLQFCQRCDDPIDVGEGHYSRRSGLVCLSCWISESPVERRRGRAPLLTRAELVTVLAAWAAVLFFAWAWLR